ncbi:transcriptional regulator, GntR family [Aliiruegeria lutimaris]|uniref:Transcriptional regulator, GntR family n=1 Tax=Aliiruegeria lutimaris TaxID=571298 RepID=A0A1G8K256_9RHOB|nr:transcriptional regulator, GntR family [Aliiruegeria lutimaris]
MTKKKATLVTTQEAKTPEHQAIYQRLRDLILFGEVEPGQPVTIMGLAERIGAGMTPIREAIRRLTAEGALTTLGNRRICVPVLTENHLEQIAYARLSIEPELAFRAAKIADSRMISELRAIDSKLDEAIEKGHIRGYLEQNYRFHFHLYERAGAEVLETLAKGMWMRVGPSLRIVCGRYGTSNLPDQHGATLDALAAGDPHKVQAAMEQDIAQGLDQIRQSMIESNSLDGSTGTD